MTRFEVWKAKDTELREWAKFTKDQSFRYSRDHPGGYMSKAVDARTAQALEVLAIHQGDKP